MISDRGATDRCGKRADPFTPHVSPNPIQSAAKRYEADIRAEDLTER